MRESLEKELKKLNSNMIRMAHMAEDAIRSAIKALEDKDANLARSVILEDEEINAFEKKIEAKTVKLIYREQPVAADLRTIFTALKMVTDIERIGDHAADISQVALKTMGEETYDGIKDVHDMAYAAIKMVEKAVKSFANHDLELAKRVAVMDDEVDKYFDNIKSNLIEKIKNPKIASKYAEQLANYLLIIKYIERIADHATNIAEWVIFNITGNH
ncbi:MAG: phosphate signaling complex protein PhoU [Firmicutes bacterium]|nr:phosphate signaling complex protein PhoU [Bacillota bacterium]MCL2256166.1 phosphate signaling complex protein PhoU [Bacillota bacterium]